MRNITGMEEKQPRRKPNRLSEYDYSSSGAYFVTICVENRRNILCNIVGDGFPVPKKPGLIAERLIEMLPLKYIEVKVDKYVIMPNHIHMLLRIETDGTGDPSPTLGKIIGWYKYHATKQINEHFGTSGNRVFQRSYYDHVVRDENDYMMIWEYIVGNPARWTEDKLYME